MRTQPFRVTSKPLFTACSLALLLTTASSANAAAPSNGTHGDGHFMRVNGHEEETTRENARPEAKVGGAVIATVNGRPVARQSLNNVTRQLEASGQEADKALILDELINLEVLTQAGEAKQLETTPDVAAALQLQYNQTMANAYLAELGKQLKTSDAQLRTVYDEQIANLEGREYRASHILVDTEAKAQRVIAELEAGDNFKNVARRHSQDATADTGGDLGWFDGGSMVAEFSAAVERLKVGETSQKPVKSEFGWHVIKLMKKRGTAKPSFSSVKAELREQALRENLVAEVQKLREAADIQQ